MDRWCRSRELSKGSVVRVGQCWELAKRWYAGRADRGWVRGTTEEAEGTFTEVGLTGPFWELS